MNVLKTIDKALTKLFRILTFIAGGVACFMMLLSVVNVIARVFFKQPIYGTIELVSYGALIIGALACAQNEMDDGNPIMTLVVDAMRPKARAFTSVLADIICTAFYAVVTYKFLLDIGTSTASGQLTTTLEMPMNIFYTCMFIGFLCLTLAMLVKAMRSVYFLIKGKSYLDNETGGEAGTV